MSIIAVAAMMMVSCKKEPTDNGKDNGKDDGKQTEEYAGPVTGTSAWSVIGALTADAKVNMNWDNDIVMAENNGIFVVKNLKLEAADEFKIRENKGWDNNRGGAFEKLGEGFAVTNGGANIKVGAAGIYDVYYNPAVEQMAVCAKDGQPTWKEPAAGPSREGKVLKLTPVNSENAIFEKEEYADLGAGATFQVKFYANSWKTDGNCDRLCCFENYDESPSMLVRFSNDGTQPGQLRFNNNAWQIGGGDGVKLTDSEGNAYIFAAQKWHVLTMVLKPGEENAVTVDFYDNENLINSATGKMTSKKFEFKRFEFGMSWEYNFNNDEFSLWQLFDGYIDYARVWTRELSASEIAAGLCDIDVETAEDLLVYWIMNEGEENGIIPNKAGDKAYDINWSNMSEMNGGTFRKNLDLKNDYLNALEEIDTPLCEF